MGIVLNQSLKNTAITYAGFLLGAVNVLFLYTNFLTETHFGLVAYILSTANILMPLMAFGVHNTIVKFYSSFKTRTQQQRFLGFALILPLIVVIPFGLIGQLAYETIANYLPKENVLIKDYVWLIYVTAIFFAYFEVFYAWSKVHLQSVFGNFIKEVFHRIGIMILLVVYYFIDLSIDVFIYAVTAIYLVRMLVMAIYAFSLKKPTFSFKHITNRLSIVKYSALIIIAGSVALIILELDKVMIGHLIPELGNVAYYSVAIFIATVIDVPARSMSQITSSLTAQYLNTNKKEDLAELYKKSSITLLLVSGLIFLLILVNIQSLYTILPNNYSEGLLVVFIIGIAKLFNSILGNNNSILFYSDYYRVVLAFGVFIAVLTIILNLVFIPVFGLEGAALASCITIFLYNSLKIWFVWVKFKILPFSEKTIAVLVLIILLFLILFFWDFQQIPILNMILKTLICVVIYAVCIFKFNLSEDIQNLITTFFSKIKNL